jgi:hypothetical protein
VATREQIMGALMTRLTNAYSFTAVTRRNGEPVTIAAPGQPAQFILKHGEDHYRPSPNLPPRRTLSVLAMLYIDTGTDANAIPDAILNPIQDAVDVAMQPDDPSTNRCTLGGLVFSAMTKGKVINAPGDKLGKGIAIIPIEIIIP